MPELHSLLLFIAAGLLLNLTPGPDVLYIVTRSLRCGVRAGKFNAIFVNVACALLAGWTARRVGLVQRGMQGLQRGAGVLFVGFGVRLALADHPLPPAPVH